MSDEPRRSNARDAAYVEMPPCPICSSANAPMKSPVIERIGKVYFCVVCATEFLPVDG